MIDRLIEASVRSRFLVLMLAAVAGVLGWLALRDTPVDAIPDLSDVQVIVVTDWPGQAPEVVEEQVTYPLSTTLLGVPHARDVRGYSFFGLSMVYVLFDDGTDLYDARARTLEVLDVARGRLPESAEARLGPDATGVGWIYAYTLTDFTPRAEVLHAALDQNRDHVVDDTELPFPDHPDDEHAYTEETLAALLAADDPPTKPRVPGQWTAEAVAALHFAFDKDGDQRVSREELRRAANFRGVSLDRLRAVQDWQLRTDLMGLEGVSEVASVGGFVRQMQVEVDPERLRAYGVSLQTVVAAIQKANQEVGGRLIEMAETEFMVRSPGYITALADLETIPVGMDPGGHTPILLRQVARVTVGPASRRGLVDVNGEGQVVSGIVVMRQGENAREVVTRVEDRLAALGRSLPEGVEVQPSYDRSHLIDAAVDNLTETLTEEMVVVAVMCIVLLLHLRSALVAILAIPLAVLLAFIPMWLLGVNANVMSLGGIALAIGVLDDASVVLVEDMHRTRERHPELSQLDLVLKSTKGLGSALFFSLLIVTVSFLPVFALEQQEGRLFRPLALTKTFTMATASVLAVTVVPVLMYVFVRGRIRTLEENPVARLFVAMYRPVAGFVTRFPGLVVALTLATFVSSAWPLKQLGSEFMPPLNEGDLLYMPTTPPGLSITAARDLLQETDRIIATHPQVAHVWGKSGRAETATDPAPLSMLETTILLTPKETWPAGKEIEDVAAELDQMVQIPGLTNAWTMPIKTRLDMLATGIKTPVGLKLLGDDLDELAALGAEIEAVLRGVPGTGAVYAERVTGGNYIDVTIRREEAARYGLNVADVQAVVASAIGGMTVATTVDGLERIPISVRYPRELRGDLAALRQVAVHTPMGHTVPLGQVADLAVTEGPPAIKSENARRTAWITVDLETDDVGGYVKRAKAAVDAQVRLPEGVALDWSGQYASMERANRRLAVVGPLTLVLIFVLLVAHFRRLDTSALVLLGTLFIAPIGGIWAMWGLGYHLSVAVAVGFIALAGLAAEMGVVMVEFLEDAVRRQREDGGAVDLAAAVREGAVERVRPLAMTVLTTLVGLLPVMVGTEAGARVMKRLAAPMVGGLVSSLVLTLCVIPAVYLLLRRVFPALEAGTHGGPAETR